MRRLSAAIGVGLAMAIVTPACVDAAAVYPKDAAGFQAMYDNKNDFVFSGGDQSTSIKHPTSGKVYWIHGDTILGTENPETGAYDPGWKMISNTILIQLNNELIPALVSGSGEAVPRPESSTEANNERYWTQGAFFANNHLYVLCQRVENDASQGYGFKVTGVEMAKFSVRWDGKLTLVAMIATPSTGIAGGPGASKIQWAGDAINWGGYVYIYGYTAAESNPFVAQYSYVARVLASQVENPNSWKYYKKSNNTWVSSMSQLSQDTVNQPDALVPSQVGSVRVINGKVNMLHKPWNGFGSAVNLEVGLLPQGPFTSYHVFDSPAGSNDYTYMPMLHPEFTMANGQILVSINRNADLFGVVAHDADKYKPQFRTIPRK